VLGFTKALPGYACMYLGRAGIELSRDRWTAAMSVQYLGTDRRNVRQIGPTIRSYMPNLGRLVGWAKQGGTSTCIYSACRRGRSPLCTHGYRLAQGDTWRGDLARRQRLKPLVDATTHP